MFKRKLKTYVAAHMTVFPTPRSPADSAGGFVLSNKAGVCRMNHTLPTHAVIYCRSNLPPSFGDDGALIGQYERCEFYARQYGIEILETFFDYGDEPVCLRDGFALMCDFLERHVGEGIAVLVEDFLRIADSPSEMRDIIELLEDTYHTKIYDFAAIDAPIRQHRAQYEAGVHALLTSIDEYFQLHAEQIQQFIMDMAELKQQAEEI